MCGIAGWYLNAGEQHDASELSAMAAAISHRGPDDHGRFIDASKGIGLAHNRLSIIDPSDHGHQPMLSEDENTALVYNGELYNFQQIKKQLESLGHRFRSRCDTEVVLRSFMEWGPSCVKRFCGMFAFAIWCGKTRRLFLARDAMGMKPLYYTMLPNHRGMAFASELKAFLPLSGFAPQIDPKSLSQFIEFGYTFDSDATILQKVHKVPPGCMIEWPSASQPHTHRYFHPTEQDNNNAPDDHDSLADRLYDTLTQVVEQHLISDVPLGILLSGGIDSSIVAALAARHQPIKTYTFAFENANFDEREPARTVAQHIGSEHKEILIRPIDVTGDLEELVWYFDDLFGDWGMLSTRLIYQRCRQEGVKVAVVGEGSDEIFGGYPIFRKAQRGPMIWRLFQLYRQNAGRRYGSNFNCYRRIMRQYLNEANGDQFHAVRLFEAQNQLPNNYVMKVDKASMSVGVEARTPFLDKRVVQLAYEMPRTTLLVNGTNKWLLRHMADRAGLLPKQIVQRRKFGASIAASWMDDDPTFRRYARDIILDRNGWADELGIRNAMIDYFDRGISGYRFPSAISIFRNLAWRILLLNLWSRKYL